MTPASGRVNLEWTRYKPEHARIEFIDEGSHDVEREELELEFRDLIDAVLERLHGHPETRTAADGLGRAWNAINDLDTDELEFSRAAALLGIDPFDVANHVADAIVAFWERADPSVREDALALADQGSLDRVADWLDNAMETLAEEQQENDWTGIRRTLPPPDGVEPWTRGLRAGARRPRYERRRRRADRLPQGRTAGNSVARNPTAVRTHPRTRGNADARVHDGATRRVRNAVSSSPARSATTWAGPNRATVCSALWRPTVRHSRGRSRRSSWPLRTCCACGLPTTGWTSNRQTILGRSSASPAS